MNRLDSAIGQTADFFHAISTESAQILEHSHGVKPALIGAGTGGATVAAGTDWVAIIGLCLTAVSIMIAAGSLYLGYLNYRERVRENDIKEAINGSDNNDC